MKLWGRLSDAGFRASQPLIKLGSPFQLAPYTPSPGMLCHLTQCRSRWEHYLGLEGGSVAAVGECRVGMSAETVMGEVLERGTSHQVALKPRSPAPS